MIVNCNIGFLFVHIQKTAGSSISRYLNKLHGTGFLGKTHSFLSDYTIPDELFKFTFVRNPWERLVSWYVMMKQNSYISNDFRDYILANSGNFSEFIDCTKVITETRSGFKEDGVVYRKSIVFNQVDYLMDRQGRIAVDFIGRYENLQGDFDYITSRLGLKRVTLMRINSFNRDHYRKFYTDEDAEKVSSMYKDDIEYFKYRF